MSKSNRQRRAAKQKARRRTTGHREQVPGWADVDPGLLHGVISELLHTAASAYDAGDDTAPQGCADALILGFGRYGREVEIAADDAVAEAVAHAWRAGWLPSDMPELARRRLESPAAGYLTSAVLEQSQRYAPAALHPRWRQALAELARETEPGGGRPLAVLAERHGLGRAQALATMIQVLALLGTLPSMELLLPLPGQRHYAADVPRGEAESKALARVRALLAKAESTEFPEEAEALSAKAQELMSRYSLQQAMLDHDAGAPATADGRRLWLEAPYAGAKALLVQVIATSNRCRSVWSENLGFVTVVGAEADLAGVELLTTSLLLQANRAMLMAGRQVTRHGTSRTRSFRQSFLIAFATRVGERLREASASETAEVAADPRLLPVLAARDRAVEDRMAKLFPQLTQRGFTVSNAAGWGAGRAAADLALFDAHQAVAG